VQYYLVHTIGLPFALGVQAEFAGTIASSSQHNMLMIVLLAAEYTEGRWCA